MAVIACLCGRRRAAVLLSL